MVLVIFDGCGRALEFQLGAADYSPDVGIRGFEELNPPLNLLPTLSDKLVHCCEIFITQYLAVEVADDKLVFNPVEL